MSWAIPLLLLGVCAALIVWLRERRRRSRGLGVSPAVPAAASQRAFGVGRWLATTFFRHLAFRLRILMTNRSRRRELRAQYHLRRAEEVAALMGNMKGVLMKLGQILSFAADSMPEPAKQALRALQQQAPPMDFSLVGQVLKEELSAEARAEFRHIDKQPMAAASIGQVHRGRLRGGRRVAIKVQYPGIEAAIESDLKMSSRLIAMVKMMFPYADAAPVVEELKARLREELDYRQELRNQAHFSKIWQGHPYIRIPAVFESFSARRVLCQELRRGLSFYDFLEQADRQQRRFAALVLHDFVFDSMHRFGIFNGDPHPGNYLFEVGGVVTFLDFGCVKYFAPEFLEQVHKLNRAIVERDMGAFDHYVHELGIVLPGASYDREFTWDFFSYHAAPFAEDRVFEFSRDYVARAGKVMSFSNLKRLNLPPDMLLLNRITFGLNAIFARLGAAINCHRLYRRYLYPEENLPPALSTVGVELGGNFSSAVFDGARLEGQ